MTLYDDQRFSAAELELLHTPAFQRLYDLHQLGLTDRIFIDASHSRLHHVVGVVEQATNLMTSLARNLRNKPDVHLDYTDGPHDPQPTSGQFAPLVNRRIPAARLMALLHDLTHAPYGHTLEDEIRLVDEKHDEPKRQAEAFYRVVIQFIGWLWRNSLPIAEQNTSNNHTFVDHLNEYLDWPDLVDPRTDEKFIEFVASVTTHLIQTADTRRGQQPFLRLGTADLTRFLKELSFAMRALLFLESAHKYGIKQKHIPDRSYPFDELFGLIFKKLGVTRSSEEEFLPHRDAFMLDVIGNTICADLLDYAKRDAASAGLKLDYDANRIIENFTLISHLQPKAKVTDAGDEVHHPFEQHSIRTAISLFGHKLRIDVPGELLNLLQVRYYVYERMLYHPTKCIAGAMLGASVQLVGWKSLPTYFRYIGDNVFLHDIRSTAKIVVSLLDTCPDKSSPYTLELCEHLKHKLSEAPALGATKAAMQLLDDRIVRVGDVKTKLAQFESLKTSKAICREILQVLNGSYENSDVFDLNIKSKIVAQTRPNDFDFNQRADELLAAFIPNLVTIKQEIGAGVRLISRLMSRKYYKAVFRLLPNVSVLKANDITSNDIANKFQNSTTRFVAEREIESRSGLPLGSVVIHCPSADGPKKIANILITPGNTDSADGNMEAFPLYKIGELHKPIFHKHQDAIIALQEMYSSMWRLVVSVAPPETANWEELARVAGSVIYEILTRGDDVGGPIENDKYMTMEIEASLQADKLTSKKGNVWIQMPDGSEAEMPIGKFRFLEEVSATLEPLDDFKEVLNSRDGNQVEPKTLKASLDALKKLVEQMKSPSRSSRLRTSAKSEPQPDGSEILTPTFSDKKQELIETEFDAMLAKFKPAIAETEWEKLQLFRGIFIERANAMPNKQQGIINRLQRYRDGIPITPKEKLEHNVARAEEIIADLEKLLS